jgi:hypothetical protein
MNTNRRAGWGALCLLTAAAVAQAGNGPVVASTDNGTQQILSRENFYERPSGKNFGLNYFKPVMLGVLYRGGSAGTRRANDPESGVLNRDQLQALCRAGFSKVVYAYGRSRHIVPRTSCTRHDGQPNELSYEGIRYDDKAHFVRAVDEALRQKQGPVYDHCWNGWHASGELAAVALKQFCGFSSDEAVKYWLRNRYDKARVPSLLGRISAFRPVEGLTVLTEAERREMCPPRP